MGVSAALVRWLQRLRRGARRPSRPKDARVEADPWLKVLFDGLTERYQLGAETPDGFQILRRTGKARFNPMRVYLRPASRGVSADYDVRVREGGTLADGRALLDSRVGAALSQWGLQPGKETVEEWGGQVITRRYEGTCDDAAQAAEAVRHICERTEQIIDTAAE